ncbi:MAG: glycosyltransferase [Myxococcales bacterium]|nr:glycosyltransferase [Myxococcales bacterium]
MRVLQVSHGWTEGGSALYAAALSRELASRASVERFGPGDVRGKRARGFGGTLRDPAAEASFRARLREVDLVHIHHLSGLSLSLPLVAAQAGVPVVITLHDYWLACARGQLVNLEEERCPGPQPDRCAACLAPDLWAPVPAIAASRLPLRRAAVAERAELWREIRERTSLFLAPSHHVAARLGVPATRLALPLLRDVPPAPVAPPGVLRLLFLGSWLPTKGPHVLLEAFSRLPSGAAVLSLAGPSPPWRGSTSWADRLRHRALATPGVSVLGHLTGASVSETLAGHDVLVLPSTWEENAPLVLGEALAAGLRVLASDVGGVAEIAPEARLVEAGDAAALTAALADEVRQGRGRRRPVARPSMAAHAGDILARYESVLAAR